MYWFSAFAIQRFLQELKLNFTAIVLGTYGLMLRDRIAGCLLVGRDFGNDWSHIICDLNEWTVKQVGDRTCQVRYASEQLLSESTARRVRGWVRNGIA